MIVHKFNVCFVCVSGACQQHTFMEILWRTKGFIFHINAGVVECDACIRIRQLEPKLNLTLLLDHGQERAPTK